MSLLSMHSSNKLVSRRLRGGTSLLLVSLLLTGCGLLDSKKAEYKSAQRTKPLDIPPELSAPAKDDRYTVSELGSKGTTFSTYNAERAASKPLAGEAEATPVAGAVLQQSDKLRIERAGSHRWLVVPGTPDQVWGVVRGFVEARGLVVMSEMQALGMLETEWAEKTVYVPESGIRGQLAKTLGALYSTSERDKYRIRLEKGTDAGTTDVFVSHRGVEEVYVTEGRDQTRWQPRPNDPDLEAEMLTRLMQFAGSEQKRVMTVASVAVSTTPGDRARLVDGGGKLLVEVDERFDRAWRRVGLALDRNGFTVEDRDRANGLYYVRYFDPLAGKTTTGKSWFDSLAFWRSDATTDAGLVTYRVAVVGASDELSRVEVQDKSGGHLSTSTAKQILEIVRKELK